MFSFLQTAGVFAIIAAILAIAATVLAFIFIVPSKRRARLNPFGKFIHDTLTCKYLIIEKILQALYIFLTAYVILLGFFMLFAFVKNDWTGKVTWLGGSGLFIMILGPIVVRLLHEGFMMTILLVKNVISINEKLKNQNENAGSANDMFKTPVIPRPSASAPKFCSKCGAVLDENRRCPNCNH